MARRRIVLDVDTGSDDAVAIMLAATSAELDLVAVSAVAGNQEVEDTAANSAAALALVGRTDVPVMAGRGGPQHWPPGRRPPPRSAEPRRLALGVEGTVGAGDGVDLLTDLEVGTTLVVTGPCTNVAAALERDPQLTRVVDSIVVMGGVLGGDPRLPAVETNVGHDPAAAARVFAAPWRRLVHVPLDTTLKALATEADVAGLRRGGPASNVAADLVAARIDRYVDHPALGGRRAAPVHDPLLVAALIDPDLWTLERGAIAVDAELGSSGFGTSRRTDGTALVATDVDARGFVDLMVRRLASIDGAHPVD